MSEQNARDKQFQGFAKLLLQELCEEGSCVLTEEDELTIARRAYDFACHVVVYLDYDVAWRRDKGYTSDQIVESDIPDMSELPKEQA